ncbi:MAG: Aminodeoxychorismate lyase [Candidatus Nomurabacteria bacterium GW2011_GWF2_43_8]|uniref:Aminodeoxychorismate lyase n=3 Tax=Candidatus Nomuraibacteriota TaxID=1752729 RepID=A0A0G1FSP1_9BACT|nr:MAG: Aminodeoxychorismate lyase [Candidatus Nomurabacteria bacterium GW2011_GWA2_43_15]KKT18523.1 MAG: Aminodeoxychorismate lyase [Candidatus Nomurabacteria bacterium GW2011_GWB1_43_7]KKT25063.1 MAG: Aminodeoxychorismate lyase [Candidatus Nomurabacteria bacterium GW2011_GWF2_43_8]
MENFSSPPELGHPVSEWKYKYIRGILGTVLLLGVFYFLFISAPSDFPIGTMVRVEPGMNLRVISSLLKEQNIIRSRTVFESLVIILGDEKRIVSADYLLEDKLPVFEIAWRIGRGKHHMAPVSVTIPEGFDVDQIADIVSSELISFDKAEFLLKAKPLEGYLFPDTYFFLTNAGEEEVLQSLRDNFEKRVGSVRPEITKSGRTEEEIIIMASIIEREAKGDIDRKIISGILWKRISIGMPLQADAVPETYEKRGLPNSPIGNPGLEAIEAAIYPESSSYLYYLHDKEGGIHYAKSFAEHLDNKLKYLR